MSTAIRDKDLQSVQEVRRLCEAAVEAQKSLARLGQEQTDRIVTAMAEASRRESQRLADLAVQETTYGNPHDKNLKNLFSAEIVYGYIKSLKTAGVLGEDPQSKVIEIGEPMGVVAAIIPTTNPTSTTICKGLIALKARCAVVFSPHPSAVRCIGETVSVLAEAALGAGAPAGSIGCMTISTMEGTQELMRHPAVAVILATGGAGLVRAAYSSGKPAYGVGPGNVPAFVERTADVPKAVRDIVAGKCFDNGTLCSAEQAVVVDEPVDSQVRDELKKNGAYFLTPEEVNRVAQVVVTPGYLVNPKIVGHTATAIAQLAGVRVPPETRVLIGELEGVGKKYPLSIEKLSPVLAYYRVRDWRHGLDICTELLHFGGLGHTIVLHSRDDQVVRQMAMELPAFRVVVNSLASIGAVGYTTGIVPSMTLGCGGAGGNITSDNISPLHLVNVKRVAYETRPFEAHDPTGQTDRASTPSRERIREIVEAFVAQKWGTGDAARAPAPAPAVPRGPLQLPSHEAVSPKPGARPAPKPTDFVGEEDVRRALRRNEKILVNPKTIITPSARDLGDSADVFIYS